MVSQTHRTVDDGVYHIPLDRFPMLDISTCRCRKGRRCKHLVENFPKTCRLVLGPSWLSSNRAWKTAPGGCDIYRRVRQVVQALSCADCAWRARLRYASIAATRIRPRQGTWSSKVKRVPKTSPAGTGWTAATVPSCSKTRHSINVA